MMRSSTSTDCSRHGLTLIEVVAGLALIGTLLAAMLSAKSRFTGQHHRAQRVLAAVDALDELLMDQWPTLELIKGTEYGEFDLNPDMTWRAVIVEDQNTAEWHCRIIRVEILDATNKNQGGPLASVELLAADPSYQKIKTEQDQRQPGDSTTAPPATDEPPQNRSIPNDPVDIKGESLVWGATP